jgi:hypothetical protein
MTLDNLSNQERRAAVEAAWRSYTVVLSAEQAWRDEYGRWLHGRVNERREMVTIDLRECDDCEAA